MRIFRNRPLMTDNEISYIKVLSASHSHIIEFGSGLSTLEWAKTFPEVTSVETRIEWFKKIRDLVDGNGTNIKMIFAPPESCAYGENGEELWNSRVPSDYGTVSEFRRYLQIAEEIINSQESACVIFIDANVRAEVLKLALNTSIKHEILVHDVTPERQYLNSWTQDLKDYVVARVDSLVHIKSL